MTNNKLKEEILKSKYLHSLSKLEKEWIYECMESYHRQRVEGITDEVIELKYQEKYKLSKRTLMDAEDNYNQEQRRDAFDDGAKWLKEKLLSNESLE